MFIGYKYTLDDHMLGRGSSGEVWQGKNQETGETVAIKIIMKGNLQEKNVRREVKLLQKLHHKHIIPILDSFEDLDRCCTVFPLMKTDLLEYTLFKGGLIEEEARFFFTQIIKAVKYCHDNQVAHRDIKLENFLMDKNKMLYLADFAFATVCRPKKLLTKQCGSLAYSAPEIIKNKPYTGITVDMWSLGIVLYCLICNGFPYFDKDFNSMKQKILYQPLMFPPNISVDARDLISQLLARNIKMRATWDTVVCHPWLQLVKASSSEISIPQNN